MISKKEKKPLFIFDFDGTIVDSEPNHTAAKVQMFTELGITVTQEDLFYQVGKSSKDGFTFIKEKYGVTTSLDEMISRFTKLYFQLAYQHTVVFPAVQNFIHMLNKQGLPCVIASSGGTAYLLGLTEHLGIKNNFNAIFSSQQVERGKPFPDLFLYAAKQMGYEPHQCIVFEDSEAGVTAAKEAGMMCVALPMEEQFNLPIFHGYPLFTYKTAYNLNGTQILQKLGLTR